MVLVLALAGISLLGLVAHLQEPPRVQLHELAAYQDRTVKVEGTVTAVIPTVTGGWLLELTEGQAWAMAYAPALDFVPRQGDRVEATGQVERFQGRWEVSCEAGQVRLLRGFTRGDLTVADLARAPTAYTDLNLTVRGVVVEGPPVEQVDSQNPPIPVLFNLSSAQGEPTLKVLVEGSLVGALPTLEPGARVSVTGEFQYHEAALDYRLVVAEPGHGVWLHS